MERRTFLSLAGATTLIAGRGITASHAQSFDDIEMLSALPPLPVDLRDKVSSPPAPYIETANVGTAPPLTGEKDLADNILRSAPFNVSPIEVAQYFLQIGAGAFGDNLRPYAREWPERANPVIFHFFSATDTKPAGDVTAWCAAFVNWCILRGMATSSDEIGRSNGTFSKSGKPFPEDNIKAHSTFNASSGSFRCWKETNQPKRGELVVFKNAGTEGLSASCLGQGHVAFFLAVPRDGWVQVLGGNQASAGCNGAVTIANMRTGHGSRFMKYVGLK